MTKEQSSSDARRPHIYEIDLIRGITVFSVVMLHSLATTQYLTPATAQLYFVNLIIHLLHYGREIFIFITGLVLTYSYFGKQFSARKFWLKRVLLIFIPYVFWSIIYVKINNHTLGLLPYLDLLWRDILIGGASYQLYYILLALQLYIIFPIYLPFLKKVASRPWLTLSISFLIQFVLMYIDFVYLQKGTINSKVVTDFINPYQDRIFLSYQFFFLMGSFSAIYLDKGYAFLKKFGKYLSVALGVTAVLYSIYYYHVVYLSNNIFYATSVFQPSVVVYSLVVILFFCFLAMLWAKKLKVYSLVKIISDTSFGIYFVHVFLLAMIVKYILPIFSGTPAAAQMIFVILLTFVSSVSLCYVLLRVPAFSWTIGRGRKVR